MVTKSVAVVTKVLYNAKVSVSAEGGIHVRLCKRLTGVLMALVLVASLVPSASARQLHTYFVNKNQSEEIAAMLDGISSQTFSGIDEAEVRTYIEHFLYRSDFSALNGGRFPYTNAQGYWWGKSVADGTYYQVVHATGCYAYCSFVSQVIYGSAGLQEQHYLADRAGKIKASSLKAFLQTNAQAGEHIRIGEKHSVTYVSGTEEGFYYMDYAGDQNPRIWLRYTTYENFAARCNELYKRVRIFDANMEINVEKQPEPEVKLPEPIDVLSEYATAAKKLSQIQRSRELTGIAVGEQQIPAVMNATYKGGAETHEAFPFAPSLVLNNGTALADKLLIPQLGVPKN